VKTIYTTPRDAAFPDPQGNPENFVGITEEHPVKINGRLLAGGVPAAPTL